MSIATRSSPLRVGFLTKWDVADPHAASGIMMSMSRSLAARGLQIQALGPMRALTRGALRLLDTAAAKVTGKHYDYRHSYIVAAEYGVRFAHRLTDVDVIYAPVASCEMAMIHTNIPVVYMTDILMADYLGYYPNYQRLYRSSEAEAETIERRAMRRANAFICSSDWTARSAVDKYGMAPERVHTIPFGANLPLVPSRAEATAPRQDDVCRLLLLGVSWSRKGGPIALGVLRRLLDAGVNAELTVCGCVPPQGISHPKMKVIPFLSKRDSAQTRQLVDLLCGSSFLLLPTQAESFGIVFCEASACGLPSITRNTGGVGGAVRDGVNGYKLPADAGPEAYADMILELCRDRERYQALRVSSRDLYETRLNWDAWSRDAHAVIASVA